ncbi:MAG: ParB/RepB/Spo0J family partition protein [Hyphomicrobiaceae bacterium]
MTATAQSGRLGRGLASLIGEPANAEDTLPPEGEQRVVPIDQVRPSPLNPRRTFPEGELAELAASIQEKGLVQPLIVRPSEAQGEGYEIVAGERRWRASQWAGLHTIPVIVRTLSDREVLEVAIIENVQRADLNIIEEANGYAELMERYNYTQEDLAQAIGKSRSHLANTIRLLKLPEKVLEYIREGRLSAGHARPLIGRDDAERLADTIVAKDLSVREVEGLMQAKASRTGSTRKARHTKDADTRALEQELADALGLKIDIKTGSGETGTLAIQYGNYDQLEYIRNRLLGSG